MNISDIADLFERVRKLGDGRYMARCPAHEDSSPSLSMRQSGDRVLVHCHAGCTFQQISDAVGLSPREWFSDSEQDASKRVAPKVVSIERQAFRNRAAADRHRLTELGRELRRRDITKLAINKSVKSGLLSEVEALVLLEPPYLRYAELEHEFSQVLARSVDLAEMPDPLTPQEIDNWEAKVKAYCEAEKETRQSTLRNLNQ